MCFQSAVPVDHWLISSRCNGMYVKGGEEKAVVLVVLEAFQDGRKVVLAVDRGHREFTDIDSHSRWRLLG